jgi:hypothetical protein
MRIVLIVALMALPAAGCGSPKGQVMPQDRAEAEAPDDALAQNVEAGGD